MQESRSAAALAHSRSRSTTLLAGAALLALAACSSEAPTSNSTPVVPAPQAFSLASNALEAANLSTERVVRSWATIEKRHPGTASLNDPVVNSPFDLTYVGGPVIKRATNWNVYVNCDTTPAGCWGSNDLSPANFLRDLNRSPMIQVANQYLGVNAQGKFSTSELTLNGATFAPNGGGVPTASINDIFSVLFSAAVFTRATGYENLYHVFLPAGTDMCISAGNCYSPDNFNTFFFCAFHGSVTFRDPANPGGTLHVIYSVEPYQDVPGCSPVAGTPHGTIDATASTLSHEFFEAITDPDLNAWFNFLTGEEIADLCSAFSSDERMGGHNYVLQTEYSNRIHACTNRS
ncbi:MAG: hypothetical protein U0133_18780 [Gemmatimonadales bacterium]